MTDLAPYTYAKPTIANKVQKPHCLRNSAKVTDYYSVVGPDTISFLSIQLAPK